jgi:hypothetical protein
MCELQDPPTHMNVKVVRAGARHRWMEFIVICIVFIKHFIVVSDLCLSTFEFKYYVASRTFVDC